VGTAAVHAGKGTALVVQAREHQKRVRVVVRARTSYVMMMLLPAFPLLPPASLHLLTAHLYPPPPPPPPPPCPRLLKRSFAS
jgi:hypothetical protein